MSSFFVATMTISLPNLYSFFSFHSHSYSQKTSPLVFKINVTLGFLTSKKFYLTFWGDGA